jgi:Tfp pilus assembly protein PilE
MIGNIRGISLVEMSIAMLVGSLVISAAFQTHRYISRSADRENTKALLQRDICTISQFIEKDIRMAGLGLPGNGIEPQIAANSNHELSIYMNENRKISTLSSCASPSDLSLIIQDASGMNSSGWICISGAAGTVYKEILGIGNSPTGPDTIYLGEQLGAGPFTVNSNVYFAKRIHYSVVKFPRTAFLRRVNGLETPLSAIIDSVKITLRDSLGNNVNNSSASAAYLSVMFGGRVGSGNNTSFVAESTEVNIRNKK